VAGHENLWRLKNNGAGTHPTLEYTTREGWESTAGNEMLWRNFRIACDPSGAPAGHLITLDKST
jgi:hypothetical protein